MENNDTEFINYSFCILKNNTEDITPVKDITNPNPDADGRNNYNGQDIEFKLSTKIPANIGVKEVDGVTPHHNTLV